MYENEEFPGRSNMITIICEIDLISTNKVLDITKVNFWKTGYSENT